MRKKTYIAQQSYVIGVPHTKRKNWEKTVRYALCGAFFVMAGLGTGSANAAGDPETGKQVFKKCHACHNVGENAKNAIGPQLNGIVGRKAGTVEGYNYSDANKASGITWDDAALDAYLKDPKAKVPGTKMAFPGLPNDKDRQDIVAYLATFGADGKTK